jgi:lysozyme family protein
MALFRPALEIILKHEGGETVDTGGYTKWGISQKAYPLLDIKNMTIAQMEAIYKRDYWDKIQGDKIKDQNVATVIFDYAVNAGVGAAVKAVQSLVNVPVDGGLGPVTLAAINRAGPSLAGKITQQRIGFYTRLASSNPAKYGKYLKGWIKRAESFFSVAPVATGGAGIALLAIGAIFIVYKRGQNGRTKTAI